MIANTSRVIVITVFVAASTATAFAQAASGTTPTTVRPPRAGAPAAGSPGRVVAPPVRERGTATGGNSGGKADKN